MEAKFETPIQRGTKRKAKAGLYQDINNTDVDITSIQKPPSVQQRVARPRFSPGTPDRKRLLITKRRAGRPSLNAQPDNAAVGSVNDEEANLTCNVELLGHNAVNVTPYAKPSVEIVNDSHRKDKDKAHPIEPKSSEQTEDNDNDGREIREIAHLLKHRMASGQSDAVELLVHWVGESEEDATWEAEEEIQQGAEEMLYAYWKTRGGRRSVLFHKPKNPPAEIYYVFNIVRHEKHRGRFQFEVQWVGHSTEPHETTMEYETKLKNIAPQLLDEYWKRAGGRECYLATRSRAKVR
ncbi:hypothetical protein HD806DRAFT_551675 [Xylariaceae sp. AK1471]|nr:hypothetical protein HD806DRAFT_551675 [Xylariaceae sp. AK1471]